MEQDTFCSIEGSILTIRGQRVILDQDLARLYGVSTKRLNEQVKRNRDRFPKDFMFQLEFQEVASLRSQIATSNAPKGGRRYRPYVFTEHGALMAATILNSTVICGEETTWKWQYEFEEVEPIGTECPMTAAITPFARQGVARNLMEDGNDPVAGFIMPGISQADYSNALIEAVPIANGCIVMMVEHFPAIGDGTTATVPTPQYWFTMPNAVRVVCTEGPSPGGGVTTDEVRRITFIES